MSTGSPDPLPPNPAGSFDQFLARFLAVLADNPSAEPSLRVIDFGQARPFRSEHIPDRDATSGIRNGLRRPSGGLGVYSGYPKKTNHSDEESLYRDIG
jgi:hypothetical protein